MYPLQDKRTIPLVIHTFCHDNVSTDTPLVRPCFGCHLGIGMSRGITENVIPIHSVNSMNAFKNTVHLPSFVWLTKKLVPFATVNSAVYHVLVKDFFKTTQLIAENTYFLLFKTGFCFLSVKKRTLVQLAVDSLSSLLMLINV